MTKASGTAEEQRAIAYLQWTGWLQDHDRKIYEQGKRDGIEESKTGKTENKETDVSEVLRMLEKLYNDYLIRPDECKALDWAMNFIRERQQDGLEKLVKDCENRLHERM